MDSVKLNNRFNSSAGIRRGFSLIELVIVIVIIGIIAAIAIPRMSRGSQGAAESSLRANLAVMRNAIELFITEHEGVLPSTTGATFADQMTKNTDISGNVGTTAGTHIYGPYMREIPKLPVNSSVAGRKGQNGVATADAAGIGWLYTNPTTTTWELKPNTGTAKGQDNTSYIDW